MRKVDPLFIPSPYPRILAAQSRIGVMEVFPAFLFPTAVSSFSPPTYFPQRRAVPDVKNELAPRSLFSLLLFGCYVSFCAIGGQVAPLPVFHATVTPL